jgi:hypothetical protein
MPDKEKVFSELSPEELCSLEVALKKWQARQCAHGVELKSSFRRRDSASRRSCCLDAVPDRPRTGHLAAAILFDVPKYREALDDR